MSFIASLGQQTATDATGAILGIALGKYNDQRQVSQQHRLTDIQIEAQKNLGDYNYQQQMKLWEATNYKAQMAQLTKAGLNPALLYGMGGGGGQSTATGAGSASAGSAEQNPQEIQSMIGMGLNNSLLAEQRKLIQAQTEKTRAETATETQRPENVKADTGLKLADTGNTQQDTELKKVETQIAQNAEKIQGATIEEQIRIISQTAANLDEQVMQMGVKTNMDRATQNNKILMVKAELTGQYLRNNLTKEQVASLAQSILESKSNIEVNAATINEITASILQKWAGLKNEADRNAIQKNYTEKLINLGVGAEIIEGVGTVLGAMGKGGALQKAASRNPIGFKF